MGCNTSQELKTTDSNDTAAPNGGSEGAGTMTKNICTDAASKENGDVGSAKSDDKTINHHKHSIISNVDVSCKKKSNEHSPNQCNSSVSGDINGMKSKKQEQLNDNSLQYNNGLHSHNKAEDKKTTNATNYSHNTHNDERKFSYNNDTSANDVGNEAQAATKIQAVFRGHKVRKTTMKKVEAKSSNNESGNNNNGQNGAVENQTDPEPTKAELEAEFDPNDKELCDAASKIQATFRGHLQRKMVNKDAPDDEDIQEITKKVAEELDIDLTDPELNKAATKIQASFRGHKTRKDATTD